MKDPLTKLGGNSLRVYIVLLEKSRKNPVGVRELQRYLGFKSPSSAKHHLDRLVELGLAKKTSSGEYVGVYPRKGLFSIIFVFTGKLLPLSLPFTIFALSLALVDIYVNGLRDPLLFTALMIVVSVMVYQSIFIIKWLNILKKRPVS
jgi:DNA-binding transcriptional ArsR family regulator